MKLYTVIPIAKVLGKDTLTYFGGDEVALGSLVSIPLRKKSVSALVVGAESIEESKAELKSSDFSLKKMGKIITPHFLSEEFIRATEKTAYYYGSTLGTTLKGVLPALLLENIATIKSTPEKTRIAKKDFYVLQDGDDERFSEYRAFIRSEFAKHHSVSFVLPTLEDIRRAESLLNKGIEEFTVVLHSGLTKKTFLEALHRIENTSHPLLIITTPHFLAVERVDLGSIILDRENSRSYRTQARPYIDLKIFVKNICIQKGLKLVLGDTLLTLESLHCEKEDEYIAFFPLKFRTLTSAETLLVDMKLPKGTFANDFKVLSHELEALIDKTMQDSEHLFIFSGRKGLSPTTVCGDCGQVVTCERCGAPVTLYKRSDENIFACNKCGFEHDPAMRCTNCNSWKLESLGVGIEKVEQEIIKRFPDAKVFRMDKESVSTPKRARDMMKKFLATPGSVLLGTELALLYLDTPIQNIAVASMDSLFAVPDFRINEKILYMLISMRARAEKVFLIQTRNAGESVFDFALKGNLSDFYRREIAEREKFGYPPFQTFVKLSLESRGSNDTTIDELAEYLKEWNPSVFESLNKSKKGHTIWNLLFRFSPKEWPSEEFLLKSRTLPPNILMRVDPESLL